MADAISHVLLLCVCACSVIWDCKICWLHLCRVVRLLPPNKVACWLWVAIPNASEGDPGDRVVCDLVAKVVMWLATLHFSCYWATWGWVERPDRINWFIMSRLSPNHILQIVLVTTLFILNMLVICIESRGSRLWPLLKLMTFKY